MSPLLDIPLLCPLAVVALCLLDYRLSALGVRAYRRLPGRAITYDNYELNPMYQEELGSAHAQPYSIRHLAVVAAIAIVLMALGVLAEFQIGYEFLSGMAIATFGGMNLMHLENISFFKALARHPDLVQGAITYRYAAGLIGAANRFRTYTLIFATMLLVFPVSPFLFGCVTGSVTLWIGQRSLATRVLAQGLDQALGRASAGARWTHRVLVPVILILGIVLIAAAIVQQRIH